MKCFCFVFLMSACLTACEKNVNLKLNNADSLLVVDAVIEDSTFPTVVLTRSFDYFSRIDPRLLSGIFVHDAVVKISNGTLTHTMKEYSFALGGGYTGYIYGVDSTRQSTAFTGQFGGQYTLSIEVNGMQYQGSTTIPFLTKYPDSVWFRPAPMNPDTNKRVLMVKVTDPPGLGNYIRYFTKKNSEGFYPGRNSVFDDAVIDGTTYSLQVDPGVDANNPVSADSNFFKKGDTVTLKISNIDKATYTFWNTWEFAQAAIGNPFAQPNKVIGNISNGALGAFCGYSNWFKTLIAR
jgi:hypothetical protein